jgi:hypothetical protein
MRFVRAERWHVERVGDDLSEASAFELAADGMTIEDVEREVRESCGPQWCGLIDGVPAVWMGAAREPLAGIWLTAFLYTRAAERQWVALTKFAVRGIIAARAEGCRPLISISAPLRPKPAAAWFRRIGAELIGVGVRGGVRRYVWGWRSCARSVVGATTPTRSSAVS